MFAERTTFMGTHITDAEANQARLNFIYATDPIMAGSYELAARMIIESVQLGSEWKNKLSEKLLADLLKALSTP